MSKILISYRSYPITIGRYFKHALLELGHTVWHVGSFSPTIPWNVNRDYSDYLDIPDQITPDDMTQWFADDAVRNCPFTPDAIISVDAVYRLVGAKETKIKNAIILTDPHCLHDFYLESLNHYDLSAVMQMTYMPEYATTADGHQIPQLWLPYAASPKHHFWSGKNFNARPIDVMIISGLMYANRKAGFDAMTDAGLVTYQDSGLLLDQSSEAYGESVISYNWSSERDLCARFWEGLAMRNMVLTNRLDELQLFSDLQEGIHYEAFGSIDELVDKATFYSRNRDAAWEIASRGYAAFYAGNHTYTQRIGLLLDAMGLPKQV